MGYSIHRPPSPPVMQERGHLLLNRCHLHPEQRHPPCPAQCHLLRHLGWIHFDADSSNRLLQAGILLYLWEECVRSAPLRLRGVFLLKLVHIVLDSCAHLLNKIDLCLIRGFCFDRQHLMKFRCDTWVALNRHCPIHTQLLIFQLIR